jgi:ribonuclease BN (tRNA processing enzyme)
VKIKFIGTGSGKTSLKRYHTSFLISSTNHNMLVDCGDGIPRAVLNQNVSFNSIDSILISHLHADHYAGLPSLLTQMKLTGRNKLLSLFIHSSDKDFIKEFILHSYLFKERMSFELKIIPFNEEREINVTEKFNFIAGLNSHLDKYKKYDAENKLGYASLSFLFKDDENSLIYSGDIGTEKDLYLFNQKVDLFITETTHIKFDNVVEVLEKLNPGKLILTHIGDEFEKSLEQYLESLPKQLKSRIILAFDGLELNQIKKNPL